MKRFFLTCACLSVLFAGQAVFASSANRYVTSDGDLTQEQAEGQIIERNLQAKQATCADLTSTDFFDLGEYYMGQMNGISHLQMDALFIQAVGEEGAESMHQLLGRNVSGCASSTSRGGWAMAYNYQWAISGWLILGVFVWILIATALLFVVRSFWPGRNRRRLKSPDDILNARYALGEISRDEFVKRLRDIETKHHSKSAARNRWF